MEADSAAYDNISKKDIEETVPFHTNPGNLKVYLDLTCHSGEKCLERQIVERLQSFGLLPKSIKCPTNKPDCQLICKPARVIDRVQWSCTGCGRRQPIRSGSFFLRLQCSLLQALQMILAWCEDADCTISAEHFGVKPRIATLIFDKLDELAVKEQGKFLLGGENSVVLTEMYPDCLNRLSPDTTDQPHVHRILMLADTNHIPTAYKLHVIKEDLKKQTNSSSDSEGVVAEASAAVRAHARAGSLGLRGRTAPRLADALQQLPDYVDPDLQHFLHTRIWRQAVSLCNASRDLCAGAPSAPCAAAVQRYLDTALYRMRHGDGFYQHLLRLIAAEYTEEWVDDSSTITPPNENVNDDVSVASVPTDST